MLIGSGLQALATSGKFKPVALGQIRTAGNSIQNGPDQTAKSPAALRHYVKMSYKKTPRTNENRTNKQAPD
jgi:hypothetical protein